MTDESGVETEVNVENTAELRDALLASSQVRLVGTGTAQKRIPAPHEDVTRIRLSGMNRILRLETDDLTCSVEAGVTRAALDAAIDERGLCLPCAGGGTVGGSFALDEFGPAALGGHSPRTLLLGMTAMLADGTQFKSGARVVKNVAGFDLQKLFIGSRGRLFAATTLHLKLRPRPRGTLHFEVSGLSRAEAIDRARSLRRDPSRPDTLVLRGSGTANGYGLSGTLHGHPDHLATLEDRLQLRRGSAPQLSIEPATDGGEIVQGQIRFGGLGDLLDALDVAQPGVDRFEMIGQRFLLHLQPAATDRVLARLPALGANAEIIVGAAVRRGLATPQDPGAARLTAELKTTLDPGNLLR